MHKPGTPGRSFRSSRPSRRRLEQRWTQKWLAKRRRATRPTRRRRGWRLWEGAAGGRADGAAAAAAAARDGRRGRWRGRRRSWSRWLGRSRRGRRARRRQARQQRARRRRRASLSRAWRARVQTRPRPAAALVAQAQASWSTAAVQRARARPRAGPNEGQAEGPATKRPRLSLDSQHVSDSTASPLTASELSCALGASETRALGRMLGTWPRTCGDAFETAAASHLWTALPPRHALLYLIVTCSGTTRSGEPLHTISLESLG